MVRKENNYIVHAGIMLINFVTELLYQNFVAYRERIYTNEQEKTDGE